MKQKAKMRKSTRYFLIVLLATLLVLSSSSLVKEIFFNENQDKKQVIFTYKNKFNCEYKVNILKNKFITEDFLSMGATYVTSFIDNISMNFKYSYEPSDNREVLYNYKVIGVLKVDYSDLGENLELWKNEYTLVEPKELRSENGKININEDFVVDIQKYNGYIKDFEQNFGSTVNATFNVVLKVETTIDSDKEKMLNNYSSNVEIGVGKKTTQITGDISDEKVGEQTQYIKGNASINIEKIIRNFSVVIILILLLLYIVLRTVEIKIVNSKYKIELNKILRSCQDKIVEVSSRLKIDEKEIIDVKDFGELIKLSEELFTPILYWSPKSEEANFYVVSNNITYRFVLKP